MKRIMAFGVMMIMCLLLCGCEKAFTLPGVSAEPTATPTMRPRVTPTPAPQITDEPAELIAGVSTDQRVVSLVLEGHSDDTSMTQLLEVLRERDVPVVWFVSGVTASEHAPLVQAYAEQGIEIGNYTISAEKGLENRPPDYVIHQLERTQELISRACGRTPSLARLNGTEYTENMLRCVTAAQLKSAVLPTLYLNHRSFDDLSDAQSYVKGMVRGSIISIKLGQELDVDEYGDPGEKLDERPAIDPSPSIEDDFAANHGDWAYSEVASVVEWLIDALTEEGFELVSLAKLQDAKTILLGEPRELTQEEAALLDDQIYVKPVTDVPIAQPAVRAGTASDFDGVVFVGDAITADLEDYVNWRRKTEPEFMGGAQFLTTSSLTVETALNPCIEWTDEETGETQTIALEEALRRMGAKRVYLMLRFSSIKAYSQEQYLENLRLLIHLIRRENPEADVVVQSVLPGVAGRYGTPTNRQIFRYNLMAAKLCLSYGVPYLDAAYALRDENGDLRLEYCLDPQLYGLHLNDAGCQAWLDYLMTNIP